MSIRSHYRGRDTPAALEAASSSPPNASYGQGLLNLSMGEDLWRDALATGPSDSLMDSNSRGRVWFQRFADLLSGVESTLNRWIRTRASTGPNFQPIAWSPSSVNEVNMLRHEQNAEKQAGTPFWLKPEVCACGPLN